MKHTVRFAITHHDHDETSDGYRMFAMASGKYVNADTGAVYEERPEPTGWETITYYTPTGELQTIEVFRWGG
jgi:hypothetical protein